MNYIGRHGTLPKYRNVNRNTAFGLKKRDI